MSALKITIEDWKILSLKLRRKYNHLSDEDLVYVVGEEEVLVERLAKRLRRAPTYLRYTLLKEQASIASNRL